MICRNFPIFRKMLYLHYGLLIQFLSPFFFFILISPTVSAQPNLLECDRINEGCIENCRQLDRERDKCRYNAYMLERQRARTRASGETSTPETPGQSQNPQISTVPRQNRVAPKFQSAVSENITLRIWVETPRAQILVPVGDNWCGPIVTMAMLTPRKEDYENFGYRGMFGAESEVISELERICPQANTINIYGLFGKGPVFEGVVYPFIASKAYNWQVSDWLEKRMSKEIPPTFTVVDSQPISREPNSSVEDERLIRELYSLLEDIDSNINNLTFDQFHDKSGKQFMPRLRNLAASVTAAYKQLPSAGKARREGLQQLDEGAGGAAMVMAFRWSRIPAKKRNAPITLGMMMQNDREMNSWAQSAPSIVEPAEEIFMKLEQYFGSIRNYQPPLSAQVNQYLLDPGEATKTRNPPKRPAGSNSGSPAVITTTTYFGTPGMIAAAMTGSGVGQGVGQAIGSVLKAHSTSLIEDAQIKNARNRFWQCHYQGCAQHQQLYAAYSEALLRKDLLYFSGNIASRNVPGMQNGFLQKIGSPGIGYVDNGIIHGCNGEFGAAANKLNSGLISEQKTGATESSEKAMARFVESDAFQRWQRCRDSAEIMMRPRKDFF